MSGISSFPISSTSSSSPSFPSTSRHLFFARVLALAIFLGLVLLGTSALGIIFFSVCQPNAPTSSSTIFAHATAVLASGAFAATTFLALQGILLNTVGERIFRRITPLLQGASILLLLTILLLTPTITHSLQPLLLSGVPGHPLLPSLLVPRHLRAPPRRTHRRCPSSINSPATAATLCSLRLPAPCSPTRSPIADESANSSKAAPQCLCPRSRHRDPAATASSTPPSCAVPAQRAIFHFISQTILRAQRQRVMLAMYGGLAIATRPVRACLSFASTSGHIHPALLIPTASAPPSPSWPSGP